MWFSRGVGWTGVLLLLGLAACGGPSGGADAGGRDVGRPDHEDATGDDADPADTSGATDVADGMDASDVADTGIAMDASDAAEVGVSDGGDTGVDPPTTFFVLAGRYPHATTHVGDVNGDGKLDLANLGVDAQVWLGRGDGTFSNAAVVSSLAWNFTSPRYLGHFDKTDGADIATIEFLASNNGVAVRSARGQADGSFLQPVASPAEVNTADWSVVGPGDFTGDGFDDLLFVGGAITGVSGMPNPTYYVATIHPTGPMLLVRSTAGTVRPTPTGNPPYYFKTYAGGIGDVDGDGKLDFCLTTTSTSQTDGYVVYGKGDGTFEERAGAGPGPPPPFTPGRYAPGRLVDLDGDRFADGVETDSSNVQWNNGGTLAAAVSLPHVFREVGDFNGDGVPDLWGRTGADYAAAPGDGLRGFGAPLASASLSGVVRTIPRDIDKDGTTDLVVVDTSSTSIYLSTAKTVFVGPADVQCACAGPTGF